MKIGFFDSGLGGLAILRSVAQALPQYDYEFYGDTRNLPFGDKTETEIYELTKAGMQALFDRECVLNIIACNTSSAESLRKLQDTFLLETYPDRRILGVIIPAVEELIDAGSITSLLLATKRTIESGKYERELGNRSERKIDLHGVAMPQLVPLIEAGELEQAIREATETIVKKIDETGDNVDSVILGCTHYTLLKEGLRRHFPHINFISQDECIPRKLAEYLDIHPEITGRLSKQGTRHITLTSDRDDYDHIAAEFLGGTFVPKE